MKNLLYKTKTYLVGHMQYLSGRDWREEVTDRLGSLGISCFNPYQKPFMKDVEEDEASRQEMETWMKTKQYDRVTDRMKTVRSYDLNLVDRSDFIVAHLSARCGKLGLRRGNSNCGSHEEACFCEYGRGQIQNAPMDARHVPP